MSAKCKCAEVECEECPEWIFTLADLIMCMMGLFVILWVLKPAGGGSSASTDPAIADEKYLLWIGEFRSGFGWEADPTSQDPVDRAVLRNRLGKGLGGETNRTRLTPEGTDPNGQTVRYGDTAAIGGAIYFAGGSAALNPEAKAALDQIAVDIRGKRQIFLIKGHTALDDLERSASRQQLMDLSVQRANAAAEYLAARGVDADALRVVGCSIHEPVQQRVYSPDGQALNRRVEVQATMQLVTDMQGAPPTTQPVIRLGQ